MLLRIKITQYQKSNGLRNIPRMLKTLALSTSMYKLHKSKTSVLATIQGGGVKITHTIAKNQVRDPNKSYVEGLNNIES